DVCLVREREKHVLRLGELEVQSQRLLVRVLREEARPHQILVALGNAAELAGQIASLRVLDLDHLSAAEREELGAERAREHVREVEDADSFEEFHAVTSSGSGIGPVTWILPGSL